MVVDIFKRVLENLLAYGKRSVMTILGVTWGIACYILLMAYGDDFHRALLLGMKYFGDNVVIASNPLLSYLVSGALLGGEWVVRRKVSGHAPR